MFVVVLCVAALFVAVLFVAVLQHRRNEVATRCVKSGSTFHGRGQDLSRGQDQARRHRAPPAATVSMMTPKSTRAGNVAAAAAAQQSTGPFPYIHVEGGGNTNNPG